MKNRNSVIGKINRQYAKIPNKIYSYSLSITAIGLYTYLASNSEEFNPSVKVISRALGISKTTVIKYMKELKDRNLIKCIKPGGEKVITEYEFTPLNEWLSV